MEFEQILQLIDHVSDSEVTSFQYEKENVKISVKCGKKEVSAPVFVDTSNVVPGQISGKQEIITAEENEGGKGNIIKSPLVGTFYKAPGEEEAPFVKIGSRVEKGQVLAIVEAMKLMNDIESDFSGEVAEIYVENGQPVEYGQPLFRIV